MITFLCSRFIKQSFKVSVFTRMFYKINLMLEYEQDVIVGHKRYNYDVSL